MMKYCVQGDQMQQYYICHASEDGGAMITEYDEDEIKILLSWNSDEHQIEMVSENGCDEFVSLEDMEFVEDVNMKACVLIRGEVVIPKPTVMVTEFELP